MEDRVVLEDGKADGNPFSADKLIEESVFIDDTFLGAQEIQAFFEESPYGTRCFLADYQDIGLPASEIIANAAVDFQINPLVLLTKLQVETSMIYKTDQPDQYTIDRATGCGCHDGMAMCSEGVQGFRMQVRCAAHAFRGYLDDLAATGTTISGWRVGKAKASLDEILVTPHNAATAALYTYTPWVLPYEGGNWLFWNVYRKFSQHSLAGKTNHHWIGGSCTHDGNCAYADGFCFVSDNPHAGFCTQQCARYCPESDQVNTTATFCIDLMENYQGLCVSKCEIGAFPENGGCAEGFVCEKLERFGDSTTAASVCVPKSS